MTIPADRRAWLADRLRRVAEKAEAAGAKEVAASFRQRAQAIEAGLDPEDDDD